MIRFCGDKVVDVGEQCDDGNMMGGDGCSSICTLEDGAEPSSSSSASASSESGSELPISSSGSEVLATEPEGDARGYWLQIQASSAASQAEVVIEQAKSAEKFLMTPAAEDYKQYFSREEGLQLEGVLKKVRSGRRLMPEERIQAAELSKKLETSKFTERNRYISLLKEFVSTPVSTTVVVEKNINAERLITPEIVTAISELQKTAKIISSTQLKLQVTQGLDRLKRRGIDIEREIGQESVQYFTPKSRPVQMFLTIKSMKEAAEKHSTKDFVLSLGILKNEVEAVRSALPVLALEYSVLATEIEPSLKAVDDVLATASQQDVDRIVGAVDQLLVVLEQKGVITKQDLLLAEIPSPHAAAAVQIAEQAGWQPEEGTSGDVSTLTALLSELAPTQYRQSFEQGGVEEQRLALLQYLATNERLQGLLTTLRGYGRTDMDSRYQILVRQIERVGTDGTRIGCEASMEAALRCSNDFLVSVEEEVRGRNVFVRVVGMLQDFFGINQ
jgi:cysteine-rich repeat protein